MIDEKTASIYAAALEKYGGEIQLKLCFEIGDAVENWRERKLTRLQSRIAGEKEPGNRLTKPDGDYCRDVCGCVNSCKRLKEGGGRCRDAERYDRLRRYENTGREPEEIVGEGG